MHIWQYYIWGLFEQPHSQNILPMRKSSSCLTSTASLMLIFGSDSVSQALLIELGVISEKWARNTWMFCLTAGEIWWKIRSSIVSTNNYTNKPHNLRLEVNSVEHNFFPKLKHSPALQTSMTSKPMFSPSRSQSVQMTSAWHCRISLSRVLCMQTQLRLFIWRTGFSCVLAI